MSVSIRQGSTWSEPNAVHVKSGGSWSRVLQAYVKQSGVWSPVWNYEIPATVSAVSGLDIKSLFSSTDWTRDKPKRVTIPSGTTVGASSWDAAVYLSSGGWLNDLTIDNYGSIQGIGGSVWAHSGEGGRAVTAQYAGASGQSLIVNNYGSVLAGGGAGGFGGNGGGGYYTYSYTSFDETRYSYFQNGVALWMGQWFWYWDGSVVYQGAEANQVVIGSSTYTKGALVGTIGETVWYYIRRVDAATGTTYTSGGAGGVGGRGRGYDGAAAGGSGGSAGGTNAGAGGGGGTGGDWGATGSTGSTGASGNNGSGAAGSAGGLGGYYKLGSVIVNNYGTVAGRSG